MLARMRRGYTREVIVKFNNFFLTIRQAYMQLIEEAQKTIPGLSISTDIITGFCGETEEEHEVSSGGEIASVFIELFNSGNPLFVRGSEILSGILPSDRLLYFQCFLVKLLPLGFYVCILRKISHPCKAQHA